MFRMILNGRIFPAMYCCPNAIDISSQYFEYIDFTTLIRIVFETDEPPGTMNTSAILHLGTHFVISVLIDLSCFGFYLVKCFFLWVIMMQSGTTGTHETGNIHTVIKFILWVLVNDKSDNTILHFISWGTNGSVFRPWRQILRNPFIGINFFTIKFIMEN